MKKLRLIFSIIFLLLFILRSYSQNDTLSYYDPTEKIKQFHADILVKDNGNIIVTETIKVYSTGNRIDHGIFRELPMKSNSPKVSNYNFYTVLNVSRNGFKESYHVKRGAKAFEIYIGNKNINLSEGTYTYKLTYEVEAQVHSYNNFDEVYWNITGNKWLFEIENVTAKIILPKTTKAFQAACYTGIEGSKEKECNSKITNNFVYFTSKNLKAGEGFTVAAGFPKGFIHKPLLLPHYKIEEFLSVDKVLSAIAVISLCFAFYYFSWKKHGEDPLLKNETKTYDLKNRYSAISLNYIKNRSLSSQTLLVAIIRLSVKGAIEISDSGKKSWQDNFKVSLLKGQETSNLSMEENAVLKALFKENDSLEIDNKTYLVFNTAKDELELILKKQYNLKDYFSSNSKQILIGFLITLFALIGYCYYAAGTIFVAAIFGFTLLVITFFLLKAAIKSMIKLDIGITLPCLFLGLFSAIFCYASFFSVNLDKSYSLLNLLVLFLIISGFSIFLTLISTYTELGVETKSQIEKLKQHLLDYKLQENANPISIYEENLPYAFALEIEDEWNAKFIEILKELNYTNNWVKTSNSAVVFSPSIYMSFKSSYTTYSSSSSSGSSGGGSSGGGGGGGGGGGW